MTTIALGVYRVARRVTRVSVMAAAAGRLLVQGIPEQTSSALCGLGRPRFNRHTNLAQRSDTVVQVSERGGNEGFVAEAFPCSTDGVFPAF